MSRSPYDPKEVRHAAFSAIINILFFVELERDKPEHVFVLRRVLNELVWRYSQAHLSGGGKYIGCPTWSEKALNEYHTNRREWWKNVALDHVVERRTIIENLLLAQSEDDVRNILLLSETCVVLRSEHRDLPRGGGWARYGSLRCVDGPMVPSPEFAEGAAGRVEVHLDEGQCQRPGGACVTFGASDPPADGPR